MRSINSINRGGQSYNVGFFKNVRQISGTIADTTGNTEVGTLPAGYTVSNIMFLSLMVTVTDGRRVEAAGISSAIYPYVGTDGETIYIHNASSSCVSCEYTLTLAHL